MNSNDVCGSRENAKKKSGAESGCFHVSFHNARGELIKRTYDYVITGKSVQGTINNLKVVGSRPHTTVTFQVEKDRCVT